MDIKFSLLIGKHFLKSMKILRVWKLVNQRRSNRLFKFSGKVVRYAEVQLKVPIPVVAAKLFSLAFWTFVLSHWMGCLQFLLVRLNDFPEDSWLVYSGLEKESAEVVWCWSLYKAMAQLILIGFETPPFVNGSCDTLSEWCQKEHWMTLVCLYVGAIYYSFLISSMLSILQSRNYAAVNYHQKLNELDNYSKSLRLPADLRENIREHFQLNHSSRMLYNENAIMKMLTPQHVREINKHKARGILQVIPLLSAYENREFAQTLASYLHRVVIGPEEIIFRKNTPGDSIYFILKGTVGMFNTANPIPKPDNGGADVYCDVFIGTGSVSCAL